MLLSHRHLLRSTLQINISHVTKAEIIKNLASPDRSLFKRAQMEIFKLLEQAALPKFLKGPEYASMLQCIEAARVTASSGSSSSGGSSGSGSQLAMLHRAFSRVMA